MAIPEEGTLGAEPEVKEEDVEVPVPRMVEGWAPFRRGEVERKFLFVIFEFKPLWEITGKPRSSS